MTNQEAIETIQIVEWKYPMMNYAAAFEMAIEALRKEVTYETNSV